MRLPSALQTGERSVAGSEVSRVVTPRANSYTQISALPPGGLRSNASLVLSGESESVRNTPGSPTVLVILPWRSNQVSWPRTVIGLDCGTLTGPVPYTKT